MSTSESDPIADTVEFPMRAAADRDRPDDEFLATSFDFGAASDVGLRRSNNEDHFAVVRRRRARKILLTNVDSTGLAIADDDAYVLIVADGIGGCGFGEMASELVLRIGWELAGAAPSWIMKFNPKLLPKIRDRIKVYVQQIQQELREYAQADPKLAGMGTTWTCAYVIGPDAIIAHVGDSRAYQFREGKLLQLTRDHTLAQILQDAGVPPEDTATVKHLLVNSLGAHAEEVQIDVAHVALQPGDRLLLCSDGLTDMVTDGEIVTILETVAGAQTACDALIANALCNGGKDNVTAVVADLHAANAGLGPPGIEPRTNSF